MSYYDLPDWRQDQSYFVVYFGYGKMTKTIPFTIASLARAIRGVEAAGRFVVGVKPDGTLIVGDRPLDTASLVPVELEQSPPPARRMGEYFNGGQGEA